MTKCKLPLLLLVFIVQALVAQGQQKNVLVIMVDDFNHWIKPVGYYDQAITPNINALAKKGVLFRDASSPSPVCNPSRNAIWSGIRASTSGISRNQDGFIRDKTDFQNVVTMNQYFSQNNYYTYAGGKIYHPGRMGDRTTDPDNWSSLTTQRTGSPGGSFYRWESDVNSAYVWSAGTFDLETSNDTQLARHFAEKISNYDREEPFFMAMGLFRPHLPFNCHKDFFDLFDPDTLNIPQGYLENDREDILANYNGTAQFEEVRQEGEWKNAIRAYLANMAYADFNVGIVLEALNNSPFKDNTIVVFMGDHGWHLGEKDRLSKHAVFDQASRTTFIIYDPSAKGNGQVCQKVVSLQDVYPTLINLCGLQAGNTVEGENLQPLLEDPQRTDWDTPIMMTYSGTHIIKTNKWRFVDDEANSQLYDIENDPFEFKNLYNEPGYGAIVQLLRNEINRFLQEGETVKKNLVTEASEQNPIGSALRVFPNPAQEQLIISGLKKNRLVEIFDSRGKKMFQVNTREHVDITSLEKGIYFLKVNGFAPLSFLKQ